MWALLVYYARGLKFIWSTLHEPYFLSLPLTWVASLKIYFRYLYCIQNKSSNTWVILLPSAKGISFTFMLSLHLLTLCTNYESIVVILSMMCIVPKFIIDWFMNVYCLFLNYLYLVNLWAWVPLCYVFSMIIFNAHLFMIFCLSYFSCLNIVAELYC